MTLDDLISPIQGRLGVLERIGNQQVTITGLTDDSRKVEPGSLFVAVPGERVDGHDFVDRVLAAGAAALVVGRAVSAGPTPTIRVQDSRAALGMIGSRFYGDPSVSLRMIGVTGTNGKTTTTYVVKTMLEAAKRQVGLIGTVAYLVGKESIPASHTTPGALELQKLFARMVEKRLDTVVMEVSSHALALDRTAGSEFDVAVFTNLTQDHLDFHVDMERYFQAKRKLFVDLGQSGMRKERKRAILNLDDPWSRRMREACTVPVWTYGLGAQADLRAEDVRLSAAGTDFTLRSPAGTCTIQSRLVGEHNVYNLLAAIGVVLHEGLTLDQVRVAVGAVSNVPGRFERVDAGQDFTVVVDYAHTEDALVRLLTAAQALRTGRIITVFGCGGDRDRTKRPKMGRAAVQYSDVVILTSDNPRTEDPAAILREVEVGVKEALANRGHVRYQMLADRRAAIEAAIREAKAGDMVLIAGKGHEDYQIVGTTKHHFDDREVAREMIGTLRS
ncbi:UDP-N-acetylmuramoyl-L-alanyl-D-glutamate--2,6-diaminopimelate ligase [Nitrospira defluvii]|uniref:UDP-N-acetylmuramoyl-L-alanyl-D-glutamate--2,6-diaminopimelate ligase n=1 Tax=Nitrospira defluvii TaxID=330214 RepID=A0ABN7KK52_9BACT|nr:UDP-N-acetylmuramoyl-L-alanyl-D-glutamate--2,6-diaminopimelate ligase [Nitrospira defluvii]CAE6697926.1 UDP-N-acetylmuramoyl-L-alanyl-D-glutamate--2, 6-diaminopimelate ligase [Nitrospira defluvii]